MFTLLLQIALEEVGKTILKTLADRIKTPDPYSCPWIRYYD